MQLSKLFLLEVDSGNREDMPGSQFTEYQRGSSSALLRAEGEEKPTPPPPSPYLCPPVAVPLKPNQFVGIHSYLPYMALSLSLFHCHCSSSALLLSLELPAAACQRNAVN